MKKLLALSLFAIAFNANADIIDKLKNTPVNQFEYGQMKLGLSAYFGTQEQSGIEVGNTGLKLQKMDIKDSKTELSFIVSFVGRSKDLSEEACKSLSSISNKIFKNIDMIKGAWPYLSDAEHQELVGLVKVTTELVSKENSNLKITCQ